MRKSRKRNNRRERRKAKQSDYAREPLPTNKKGHHSYSNPLDTGPAIEYPPAEKRKEKAISINGMPLDLFIKKYGL